MLPSQQWKATLQLAMWARPASRGVEAMSHGATPPIKIKERSVIHILAFYSYQALQPTLTRCLLPLHHRAPPTPSPMLLYLSRRQLKMLEYKGKVCDSESALCLHSCKTPWRTAAWHIFCQARSCQKTMTGAQTAKSEWMHEKCILHFILGRTKYFSSVLNSQVV